jgi:hypothetical protein
VSWLCVYVDVNDVGDDDVDAAAAEDDDAPSPWEDDDAACTRFAVVCDDDELLMSDISWSIMESLMVVLRVVFLCAGCVEKRKEAPDEWMA